MVNSIISLTVINSFLSADPSNKALFIDTEFNLPLLLEQFQDKLSGHFKRLFCKQITDSGEYDDTLSSLEDFLKKQPDLKLVVIDSFTIIFKNSDEGLGQIKNISSNILRLVRLAS